MTDRLRLAVLVPSLTSGRMGPVVARWFEQRAREDGGFDIDVVDLLQLGLHPSLADSPGRRRLAATVAAAAAVVVVTPEHNHSFPGYLKTALDSLRAEWQGKPVAFVSYGGMSGGLRAVEQLRQVVAELHMVSIRETVSFHRVEEAFDADGHPHDAEGTAAAAKRLLHQLAWWAQALAVARRSAPYPG